ncbi:MAG: DUF1926 domain-containing protein [Treponema sp.]|nr:DUF1926 domain-containing protein [Treponema sp.]
MTEEKIFLILGSHAHVPSGAPETEFKTIYEKKLRPFVCGLYKNPKIQAVLHYSGVLLHWIERNHPEFFMLIEDMINRRQVEILGGGFYEPMLPLIPLQDRIGQIEFMTTYLRKNFGKRPQGCWIPAFAWEQHLASTLAVSGMNYTFLTENQFIKAGFTGNDLLFPCISEDQGKIITVFPVSNFMGEALNNKNIIKIFRQITYEQNASSGEKKEKILTIFPENYGLTGNDKTVEYNWNLFFEELSLSEKMVETSLPGKLLKNFSGFKKGSFPNSAGYDERYLPRSFIIENPQANGIYSKMIFTNVLISQLRGDKSRKQNAREELWKAQDSSLFTPSSHIKNVILSKSAYQSLLCAERLTREKGKYAPSLIQYDFDLDGIGEYLFQDARINCYIQTMGAGIFELDYIPKAWNYLACGINSTGKRQAAFNDCVMPEGINIKKISNDFHKGARNCFNERYEAVNTAKGKAYFCLKAGGGGLYGDIEIEKRFSLKKDILTVEYLVKNTGKQPMIFSFIPEINLSFAGEGEEFVRFQAIKDGKKEKIADEALPNVENIEFLDLKNEVQIILGSAKPFNCFLSQIRKGNEYISTRIIPQFNISLENSQTWNSEINLKFSH